MTLLISQLFILLVYLLHSLQVAAKSLETGIFGARCNVLINCKSLTDSSKRETLIQEANTLYKEAQDKCQKILERIEANQK